MLRCAVLMHIRQETYRGLEFALRDSLSASPFVRIDSTVTSTHILSPTDSRLLYDGVRVLTRLLSAARDALGPEAVAFHDHRRAAKRRHLEIGSRRSARRPTVGKHGIRTRDPGVTGRYSNQLNCRSVGETPARPRGFWWVLPGSNLRLTACKAVALPAELNKPFRTNSGLDHAVGRAPCVRFAAGVAPEPRNTRFRLAWPALAGQVSRLLGR